MTTSNPDPINLLEGVDLSDIYVPADVVELSQRSVLASRSTFADITAPAEAVLRLSGDGVRRNRIGARQASRILGSLQEVFAAIGQSLSGSPTSRGSIPNIIRQRTALNLFPATAAGSVQLHLETAIDNSTMPLDSLERPNLADEAAGVLMALMDEVGSVDDDTTLIDHLRTLGPRVARQVQILSTTLVRDDVDLDLSWRRFAERPQVGQLHRDQARRMQDAIRRSRVDVQIIPLVGQLVTVSRVRPAALVLDSGRILALQVDEELTSGLGPYFDQRVRIEAEESITHQESTGRSQAQYRLIRLELASETQTDGEQLDPEGS